MADDGARAVVTFATRSCGMDIRIQIATVASFDSSSCSIVARDGLRDPSNTPRSDTLLSKNATKRMQAFEAVAEDLGDGQQGHRDNGSADAPNPTPNSERHQDHHRIQLD